MSSDPLTEFLNKEDGGYIGIHKPKVERHVEPHDPYLYQRWQASKLFGIHPDDLPDEPDEMYDHSDQQGYDDWSK